MTGLHPVLSLLSRAARALAGRIARARARSVDPTAPADLLLPHVIRLANLERRHAPR